MSNEKQAMKKDVMKADEQARQAWRGWVIPAVGSMAFFASMILNGVKNYKTYGFPAHVFNRTDWILLSLPVIVIGVALSDILVKPKEQKGD